MLNIESRMMNIRNIFTLLVFAAGILIAFQLSLVTVSAQIAVKGDTVWTMAGEPLTNGIVLINNGKIEAVGTAATITIPANYTVVSAKVVTPGLIDQHTVIGLNGYLNQPHDQMALDGGGTVQPELRATDAYNTDERLIQWVREFGVTTINTGHQPSALIFPGRPWSPRPGGKPSLKWRQVQ